MSDTDSRYRETLHRWAYRHVPPWATDLNVRIVEDPGYNYSSYTFEDPHVDVEIDYTINGERDTTSVTIDSLGDLLHSLFAIEETP